ncbi:MAG: CRISPR-associated protein Cas5 [Planctomycetaceae bacterium]|jgi:CRISPR-associated protein Cas5d|nr:CRISPR-associated protein Cas5 [Planctomycetaceae bacterium]
MEIAGYTAMWTRPDTGDCPVSYPVPTYSAVKAIFESVHFGFKTIVKPTKVEICSPVQYNSYHTNYGGPLRKGESVKSGDGYQMLATVLIDVCYRLYADVEMNCHMEYDAKRCGWAKNPAKPFDQTLNWDKKTTSPAHAYQAIFQRRLKRGQCFVVPCLGWKEFTPSYFGEFRKETRVQEDFSTAIPSLLRQVFPDGCFSELRYVYNQNVTVKNGVLLFNQTEGRNA